MILNLFTRYGVERTLETRKKGYIDVLVKVISSLINSSISKTKSCVLQNGIKVAVALMEKSVTCYIS